MMSHFNLKSLAFYGVMIGSVLILFKTVTAYGESNLKAPVNISGTYRVKEISPNDCLTGKSIDLTINQSGRYLGAILSLTNPPQNDRSPISSDSSNHSGATIRTEVNKPEEILLSGLLASPIILNNDKTALGSCSDKSDQLRIEIQPKGETTTGNFYWSSQKLNFIAEKIENETDASD